MSLNKLTTSSDYLNKQYLNLGCNDIKCSTLEVKGDAVVGNGYGTYVPTITVDDGSTIQNPISYYTKTGNSVGTVLDIAIHCQMTVSTSTASYRLTCNLPENYNFVVAQTVTSVGRIHNKGGAYSNYTPITTTTTGSGGTTFQVEYNSDTATFLPVASGNNYVNLQVKLLVKK